MRTYFIIRTGRKAKTLMLIRPKQMLKQIPEDLVNLSKLERSNNS